MPNRRQIIAAGLAAALPLPAAAQQPLSLQNDHWRIDVAPQTLALTVTVGDQVIPMSRGVATHAVTEQVQTPTSISWTWDGAYKMTCALDGDDFRVDIVASAPGQLDILDQPGEAFGEGLIYPKAEGHYAPAGDAMWQAFLADNDTIDTTQDLSLPLWGQDHSAFVLTWLLLNPFNNQIAFDLDGGPLGLKFSHAFTSLSPRTPMSLLLHLGGDVTAGARRYRQYLIDSGTYETLDSKIARTPSAAGLIGASHTYLWGNGLIGVADIRDWRTFARAMDGTSDIAVALRGTFDKDTADLLTLPRLPAYQRSVLVRAVNDGLETLARQRWQTDNIDMAVLVGSYHDLRRQFAATFGHAMAPDPATWGEGLSPATLSALQKAGLEKLWVGLGDGWEGGLWHPETVGEFVKAGYLIGPYDSYETANAPGARPDWATAQLGRQAYDTAGVMKKDGTVVAGFQHSGYYTDTICITPILKARIAALEAATGFNSWFIDVFTTGMVFDDYRPGHEMTMGQNAVANGDALRWIGRDMQLPVGSEDGNATTADGAFFAHGMQTPVMGWGDPDLQKNKDSPYYLGNWYPSDAPGIFFKTVPLKEPYRTRNFAPQTRLPLYQTVFHGSVITTHHWSYDSLKFNNVRPWSELAQLLYNVPPLYHLSADTLTERLPVIRNQDAFFRPLHEALATKTLDGFAFLSGDRLIQQTIFSDSSRLIANFDIAPRKAGGIDLPPASLTALVSGQPPRVYLA